MNEHKSSAEKYRPKKAEILLIGESPPSGKKYFYWPTKMNPNRDIKNYNSLPATIFYHFFQEIPSTPERYEQLLVKLQQEKHIFLMDIIDEPLKIRDKCFPNQINPDNLEKLKSRIPHLREKIRNRGITISDDKIIFLLPRQHYKKELKQHFPDSKYFRWKEYRLSCEKEGMQKTANS